MRLPSGLNAIDYPADGESAGSPPVLLLHGMMGGPWQFRRLQPALARAGRRSVALDYRGHRDSRPVKRLGSLSIHDYLCDALELCSALQTRPIVVGQSMGGLIAQLLAERGAVGAAVLTGSLPPAGIRWRSVQDWGTVCRSVGPVLARRPLRPRREQLDDLIFNGLPPDLAEECFRLQVPESSRVAAEISLGLIRVRPERVTCPMLCVTFGADRLVLPDVGRAIADRYRAEHLLVEDAGHYALVGGAFTERVVEAIVGWVAER